MLSEYRRHRRHALMSSVQATGSDGRSVVVTITNIGDGGFGFISKEEFSIGDVLRFRLLPPAAEGPISLEARVRWTGRFGAAGCEYTHIPPSDLSILDGWLKSKIQIKKPLLEIRPQGAT
jgi:hypothetical protein